MISLVSQCICITYIRYVNIYQVMSTSTKSYIYVFLDFFLTNSMLYLREAHIKFSHLKYM
jgi:hypothetical protein